MNNTVNTDHKSVRKDCAKSIPFDKYTPTDIYHMDGREIRLTFTKDVYSGGAIPVLVRIPVEKQPKNWLNGDVYQYLIMSGIAQEPVVDYKGKPKFPRGSYYFPRDILVLAGVASKPEPECLLHRYGITEKLFRVESRLKKWYRSCVIGTRYLKNYVMRAKGFAHKKLFKESE
jgi:hypothetical protein